MNRISRPFAIGIPPALLALTLLPGCRREQPKPEEPPPAPVVWKKASVIFIEEWTELLGTTTPLPDRAGRVTAAVEGRVQSILGDGKGEQSAEGRLVEKGTVLVQLDTTVIDADLQKLDAQDKVLHEEEHQAQLASQFAANEVERLKKLKAEEDKRPGASGTLVSPVALQKAEFDLKDALSKLSAAKARLAAGEKDRASLRAKLKFHSLTAPITGRVGRILVVRGQTLAAGAAVADIIDIGESIDVLCFVPPSMIARLKIGQLALIGGLDTDPTTPGQVDGQIVFIADQAEVETGNFAVKVRFSNKEVKLPANRVVRIRVQTHEGHECVTLPESAVQDDEDPPTVVVVLEEQRDKNGKKETVFVARRLQATLGIRDRTKHQVEIIRLDDANPEKDPTKKWKGDMKSALFVVEGGQGLQTGDLLKRQVEEE